MTYVSLLVSEEAGPACIRELGTIGCFQFTDLNPELTPFQRRYVTLIKRCDEIERKIRYVHSEVKKMNVPLESEGSVESFIEMTKENEATSGSYLLESLESKLDVYEEQLLELNKFCDKLTVEYSHKVRESLSQHKVPTYDDINPFESIFTIQSKLGRYSLSLASFLSLCAVCTYRLGKKNFQYRAKRLQSLCRG